MPPPPPNTGQLILPGLGLPIDDTLVPVAVWTPPPPDTITRFWAKVTRTPGCWWWGGAVSHPDGYGRISWTHHGQRRTLSAHRFALLLDTGPLGHHTVAEHHCNETLCVRVHPAHLHPGTQSANLRYAVALGRHRGPRPGDIDPRGYYARALAIRASLNSGYDPIRLDHARNPHPCPGLFDLTDLDHTSRRGG